MGPIMSERVRLFFVGAGVGFFLAILLGAFLGGIVFLARPDANLSADRGTPYTNVANEEARLNRMFFQHYLVEIELSEDPFGDVILKVPENLRTFEEFYLLSGANDFAPMKYGWYPRCCGDVVLGPLQDRGSIRLRVVNGVTLPPPDKLVEVIVPEGVTYRLTVREVAY